jgi:hypothetical protein
MKSAIVLALAIAAATPAAATERMRLVPPPEYDHPYKGRWLRIIEAPSQEEVRRMCPETKFHPLIGALACTHRIDANICTIVIVSDSELNRVGFSPDVVRRHEIAHCNGWPADHKGALVYEEWVTDAPKPAAECTGGLGSALNPKCYEHLPRLPTSRPGPPVAPR